MGPKCLPDFNQIWIFSTDFHRTISHFKEIRKGPTLYLKPVSYPNVSTNKFWLKYWATMTRQDSKFSQRCYWRFKSSGKWRHVGWLSYIYWVLRNIGKYIPIDTVLRPRTLESSIVLVTVQEDTRLSVSKSRAFAKYLSERKIFVMASSQILRNS